MGDPGSALAGTRFGPCDDFLTMIVKLNIEWEITEGLSYWQSMEWEEITYFLAVVKVTRTGRMRRGGEYGPGEATAHCEGQGRDWKGIDSGTGMVKTAVKEEKAESTGQERFLRSYLLTHETQLPVPDGILLALDATAEKLSRKGLFRGSARWGIRRRRLVMAACQRIASECRCQWEVIDGVGVHFHGPEAHFLRFAAAHPMNFPQQLVGDELNRHQAFLRLVVVDAGQN
ncbi:hypothetical protein DFH07DRAFT_767140 [Mycena maculata]|uniref:Uncharacterized protein n=1 Tax=Mycena maculata TaxID=230809 RepID=A0AAD7NUM5_9AGAR|nr:hypothetical protein DFH07DRAFT_767140 [Mycena maculata]